MMREVSLETLPNVNIRDSSHDKNLSIIFVTGSINHNVFKQFLKLDISSIFSDLKSKYDNITKTDSTLTLDFEVVCIKFSMSEFG